MLTNTSNSPYSQVTPLSWDAVTWTNGLWSEVTTTCNETIIPHIQKMFESKDISHVLENFHVCAGDHEGEFGGTDFGDGDFYKWMEAAIYSGSKKNDNELLAKIDEYIELIGRCQQQDGYISTKQIIGERQNNGIARFNNINDFEVYNFGHLFTTACLHKRITNQDNFLNIAEKAADYLNKMYQENAKTGKVQTAVCPSHYMGLVELYRTTGKKKYLDLARLAIELRDLVKNGTDDNQDKIPLKKHEKVVGHAVRANYLYAGVADLYLEEGDTEYKAMLDRVWRNLVDKKIYITGGCGALYNGTSPFGNFFHDEKVHQAYGYEYQLPNVTAYNETCAAIGSVMWAYRMFQINPRAEYFDIIERTMLNVILAAVNLEGNKYFYENMLRRTKHLDYELIWPLTRSEYISSFCCPPNLARILAESTEYAYTVSKDTLWLGMYGANQADISLPNGTSFTLEQVTEYPFSGSIQLNINEIKTNSNWNLNIRIPSWVQSGQIRIADQTISLKRAQAGTYMTIPVAAEVAQEQVKIQFDMPVRYTVAHPFVEENNNQVAIERGPLVYCMETPDCQLSTISDCMVDVTSDFNPIEYNISGRKIVALTGEMLYKETKHYNPEKLYQTLDYTGLSKTKTRLIPYFAWDNRGYGEMRIWLPAAFR